MSKNFNNNEEPTEVDLNRVKFADYRITSIFVDPHQDIPKKFKDFEITEESISAMVQAVYNEILSFNRYELATLVALGKITLLRRVAHLIDIIEDDGISGEFTDDDIESINDLFEEGDFDE